jgi:hypothetical protein
MPESQVRKVPQRRPLLGNGSVIRSSNSWVSTSYDWLLSKILSREISSICNFWSYNRENTASKCSSAVSLLSLCVHVCNPLSLLDNGSVASNGSENMFPRQQIHMQKQKKCWKPHFLYSLCCIKENLGISSPQKFLLVVKCLWPEFYPFTK